MVKLAREVATKFHALGLIVDLEIKVFGIPGLGAVTVSIKLDYTPGSLGVCDGN